MAKSKKENESLEMLVVGSKTKEALKGNGRFNVSKEALEGINKVVHNLVVQAQVRCEANGRKTIRATDF